MCRSFLPSFSIKSAFLRKCKGVSVASDTPPPFRPHGKPRLSAHDLLGILPTPIWHPVFIECVLTVIRSKRCQTFITAAPTPLRVSSQAPPFSFERQHSFPARVLGMLNAVPVLSVLQLAIP